MLHIIVEFYTILLTVSGLALFLHGSLDSQGDSGHIIAGILFFGVAELVQMNRQRRV